MAKELFNDGNHRCIAFTDLVSGDGIQSNQFLIIDGNESMVLDPGGQLTFTPLTMKLRQFLEPKLLTYIFASHQDPDIIASLESWITRTQARVICSKLWSRFVPHLVPSYLDMKIESRIMAVPDEGMNLKLGNSTLKIIPAHFLHSVGNFQIYDPVSKILFSGDMGASLHDDADISPVENFNQHTSSMTGFHQRYMVNNKVCGLWANMVRQLDLDMMVPQHGKPFQGETINQFLDWISRLSCGTDLVSQQNYQIPVS